MKNNKLFTILTSILLVAALGIIGFLGFSLYKDNKTVIVPDMVNKSINEASDWCGTLSSKYSCQFVYENSKTVDVNNIISQSVKADEKLIDTITFTVCNELLKEIQLPSLTNATKNDIVKWANDNKIKSITYIEEDSTLVENNHVIRIEPNVGIYADTPVTVYIAKSNEPVNPGSDIEVESGKYIGLSVSDFESRVKALGLKPNHNTDRDDTSSSIEKGKIVWHGSGSYEKDEIINYGVSLGEGDSTDFYISQGKYVGQSESQFKSIAGSIGLNPKHLSDRDDYSDDVPEGYIVTHGYGYYERGEDFNYGLSLGSKESSDQFYISQGKYIGQSESKFKDIAASIGLKATHLSDRDTYSDTIEKGYVVTHGYGYYERGENFNYGLSLGKKSSSDELYIEQGKYVGQSESKFKDIAASIGLKATHLSERDAYSDSIAKGYVVTHGYGYYERGENFNYGLSLGPKGTEIVKVESYTGKTESSFLSYLSSLGLKAGNRSEAYSTAISKGSIISNDTGSKFQGDSIKYVVSLGPEPIKTAVLNSFADLSNTFLATNNYDAAVEKATTYLDNAGFTNYTIKGAKSRDSGAGVLLSVTVNGANHVSRKEYNVNANIIVTICTGYE